MVNKRDVEVFIVCLSCHFDVGLFHVIGQEVPCWRFLMIHILTRVNSTNVLDEGLRIGEIGRRINSKVKLVEIGVCRK
jgi:hypothetical protein